MAQVAVTRVINATVLVELAGGTILTDPYFTARWFMRFDEPIGVRAAELPRLQAIIAGHGVVDHWQPRSLRPYPYSDSTPVYVPSERMARSARRAGFHSVEVLAWGQRRQLSDGLTIWSLPGERITGMRTNSYLISCAGVTVFVGTEARSLAPIREIAATHQVDVALLPVNGARLLGRRLVMDLPMAIAATRILGAHILIPIHYSQRPVPPILRASHGLAHLRAQRPGSDPRIQIQAPGERTVIPSRHELRGSRAKVAPSLIGRWRSGHSAVDGYDGAMSNFEKLEQEAREAAQGHSAQVDEAIQKGEQEVDQRVGESHADQVEKGGDALEKELGIDQQGGNPPA